MTLISRRRRVSQSRTEPSSWALARIRSVTKASPWHTIDPALAPLSVITVTGSGPDGSTRRTSADSKSSQRQRPPIGRMGQLIYLQRLWPYGLGGIRIPGLDKFELRIQIQAPVGSEEEPGRIARERWANLKRSKFVTRNRIPDADASIPVEARQRSIVRRECHPADMRARGL